MPKWEETAMNFKTLTATAVIFSALAATTQARELRLSAAPPPTSPWGAVTQRFVDRVAEISEGELTVNAYMGGTLGSEQDIVRQIARGRVDMGVMSNTAVSLLVPEFGLLASPYAFESAEQFDCVADNHLLGTFGDDFEAAGIRALSWMEVGYQVIFGTEEIHGPSDLAGMPIRTAPSATDSMFIQEAGGTPVPLGPNEAVAAIETGQVSAATQLSVFGIAVGYDRVAPFITLTRHQHQVGAIIMSNRTWNSLNEQEQGWINEAAPIFLELRASIRGAEGALLGRAAEGGATVIELSDEEMAQWRALAPAAQENILNDLGESARDVWDQIQQARTNCS